MYEEQFRRDGYDIPVRVMEAAMFFMISCFGGFRSFETVWTDLGALRYDVRQCEEVEDFRAVSWPVTGRFKNENGLWGHYFIPIAGVTGSGVRIFEWTQRFIRRLELVNRIDGWAFQDVEGSRRAKAMDYADDIFSKLEWIQDNTSLIDDKCSVRDDFGMQRSGRRFFYTQCLNMKVSKTDIEFQCRWQTDCSKGGRTVQRSMIHTYAELKNMKSTLLRPSKAI